LIAAAVIVGAAVFVSAQSEFSGLWMRSDRAIVIDPYQDNSIDWNAMAADKSVVGIIHRASIGMRTDTRYAERRAEGLKRGYRWGSYHLGRRGDPTAQADFYLDFTKPAADEVMALDIETLDTSVDMSLDDAKVFMTRVASRTGRMPMLYANHAVVREISRRFPADPVFSKASLWYARFRRTIPDFPKGTWQTYTLWQFSSEINCTRSAPQSCPIRVPGTQTDMDVNVCNGTFSDCRARWPF
jgi:GH25 family lysozyme M1 (1,4-beta-N-acetylmuramidase)